MNYAALMIEKPEAHEVKAVALGPDGSVENIGFYAEDGSPLVLTHNAIRDYSSGRKDAEGKKVADEVFDVHGTIDFSGIPVYVIQWIASQHLRDTKDFKAAVKAGKSLVIADWIAEQIEKAESKGDRTPGVTQVRDEDWGDFVAFVKRSQGAKLADEHKVHFQPATTTGAKNLIASWKKSKTATLDFLG